MLDCEALWNVTPRMDPEQFDVSAGRQPISQSLDMPSQSTGHDALGIDNNAVTRVKFDSMARWKSTWSSVDSFREGYGGSDIHQTQVGIMATRSLCCPKVLRILQHQVSIDSWPS